MRAEDVFNLLKQGAQLFADIHNATQHHHTGIVSSDNLKIAGDLFQVGQTVYKLRPAAQKTRTIYGCHFEYNDERPMALAVGKEDGLTTLMVWPPNTEEPNAYVGVGEVYSNRISLLVSGYNEIGTFWIIKGDSDDGYRMLLRNWSPSHGIMTDTLAVRDSEWETRSYYTK